MAAKLPIGGCPSFVQVLGILNAEPRLRGVNRSKANEIRHSRKADEDEISALMLDQTRKLIERAERVIPLVRRRSQRAGCSLPGASPLFASHGYGGRVYDVDGNEYVDLVRRAFA